MVVMHGGRTGGRLGSHTIVGVATSRRNRRPGQLRLDEIFLRYQRPCGVAIWTKIVQAAASGWLIELAAALPATHPW
ncbi:hypothetical protein K227x_30380 [Rubripirellula lacrimiformis]|uniref:Uncharacterized protein n=1 Tax=Rubripirellula lacrimiformis TaxID=1930273 RepID=A0A517NBX6_9BACT|nr:hypothetical protein [Rubripirellula lacrimiformis]QDT04645.1 hypothetical protein K227x_30380 [Rubripirellula lacrimiformis]